MSLRLVRLPSGSWSLLAAPGAQRLETKRGAASVVLEDLAEPHALARLRPATAEVAA